MGFWGFGVIGVDDEKADDNDSEREVEGVIERLKSLTATAAV